VGEEELRLKKSIGLVKSVNHAQRTAVVLWHKESLHKLPGMHCCNPDCVAAMVPFIPLLSLSSAAGSWQLGHLAR